MHMLVTGGCGFIGSHLADRLVADGHAVTILDDLSTGQRGNAPAQARIVEGDVADSDLVRSLVAEADAVFHLAAIASVQVCEEQPELAYRTNVLGTEIIMNTAATKGIPVVYASSAAVYGDNPDLPLAEDAVPNPLGAYGRHKLEDEKIAARLAASGLASAGLRFFNVYGPRQDPRSPYSGVISKFVANAQAAIPLTFFGDGEQTRDFIYVGDIVRLLITAWQKAEGAAVFNGCTGQAVSLKELAAVIGTLLVKPLATRHEAARVGDIRHSLGDPQKARTALDFDAKTGLAEGLGQLMGAIGDV